MLNDSAYIFIPWHLIYLEIININFFKTREMVKRAELLLNFRFLIYIAFMSYNHD